MASTKTSKSTIRKTADNIKNQTKSINKAAIELTDSLVEGSIASGAKWQNIFAKALKNGTSLFGKQQDLVLDTLEAVKGQYVEGSIRFGKLVEIDRINFGEATKAIKETLDLDVVLKTASKTVKNVLATKPKVKKSVKETSLNKAKSKKVSIESLLEESNTPAKTIAKPRTKKVAKKVTKKVAKPIAKAKKVVKPIAKKGTTKKLVKPKSKRANATIEKSDLKLIEGIGPKIEGLLNAAGILTYKQLSLTKVQDLRNILIAAGPRYKMHQATTWKKQARLAAAAKWNDLIELQATLKGGK